MNLNEHTVLEMDDIADLTLTLLRGIIAAQQRWATSNMSRDKVAMYIAIHAAGAVIAHHFKLSNVMDEDSIGQVQAWIEQIGLETSDKPPANHFIQEAKS